MNVRLSHEAIANTMGTVWICEHLGSCCEYFFRLEDRFGR